MDELVITENSFPVWSVWLLCETFKEHGEEGEQCFVIYRQNEGSTGRTATERFEVRHEDYSGYLVWDL